MFDLATAKTRLGITGTTQDAAVQAALDVAVALAERYCDRKLAYGVDTVRFYHFSGDTMFLPRYPIVQVFASTGLPDEVKVHHRLGTLEFHAATFIEEAEISYAGGYQVYPPDLEMSLWLMFDGIWPTMSGQGAAAAGGGAIKAIRSNGASIEYDTSSGASGGFASSGADGLPIGATSVLDTYRRTTC